MIEVQGKYYSGERSRATNATLVWQGDAGQGDMQGGMVMLNAGDLAQQLPSQSIRIQNQIGSTPRRITWGERACFVTRDQHLVDELAQALPGASTGGWIHQLEQKLFVALASLVVVLTLGGVFAVWGVPVIAQMVAFATPEAVSARLGVATLNNIDTLLEESEMSIARQQALSEYFRAHGSVEILAFRKAGALGANALTLSATTIVLTDELVNLTADDEELLAVYLHELGHARQKHVERTILQNASWLVMLSLITGDFTGATELVLTLPVIIGQMAYSRAFEREADLYAVQQLGLAGVAPEKLASILLKLEASHRSQSNPSESDSENEDGNAPNPTVEELERREGDDAQRDRTARVLFDYFSSHPATQERVAYIRAFSQ